MTTGWVLSGRTEAFPLMYHWRVLPGAAPLAEELALAGRLASGEAAMASACAMVEQRLRVDLTFMNANGLLHLDAHFGDILTDGRRLYFADLGLATSPRFDLSPSGVGLCQA